MVATKKVSVKWQMASTLFFISGVWAFWRIKKLGYGIGVYVGCFVLYAIGTGMSINDAKLDNPDLSIGLVALAILIVSLTVPVILIRKWSIAWNESMDKGNIISS